MTEKPDYCVWVMTSQRGVQCEWTCRTHTCHVKTTYDGRGDETQRGPRSSP